MNTRAVILLVLVLAVGCSKSPEEQKSDLFERGSEELERKEFAEADSTFWQINELDTQSPLGLYGQAQVREYRLQYHDALSFYATLSNARPDFAPAFAGAYRVYSQFGYFQKALQKASTYNRLNPDDPDGIRMLGESFMADRQFARARGKFQEAQQADHSHSEALQMMTARSYAFEGYLDSAAVIANELLASPPDDPQFFFEAANYLEEMGFFDTSMVLSRRSFELSNSDPQLQTEHFRRALRTKYYHEAQRIVRDFRDTMVDSLYVEILDLLYQLELDDKSILRDKGTMVRAKAGQDSFDGMMYELMARARIDDMLTIQQDVRAHQLILSDGNYNEEFRQFMDWELVKLWAENSMDPATLDKLEAVEGFMLNTWQYRLVLARNRYFVGLTDDGVYQLETYYRYHTGQPDWTIAIADAYADFRKYDEAEKYYGITLRIDPRCREAVIRYVNMLRRLDRFNDALNVFDTYSQLTDWDPVILLLKSHVLVEVGQTAEGKQLFKQIIPAAKGAVPYYVEMADLLSEYATEDDQLEILRLCEKYNPENPLALAPLAQFHAVSENTQEGLAVVDRILKVDPDNPGANIWRAWLLYLDDKKVDAIDAFEENLTRFPNNALNERYFARLLAQEHIDFERASALGRSSVFNAYGDPEYLLNLSYVYYLMGRHNLSIAEAKKARHVMQDKPMPYFRMGIAMAIDTVADNDDEARENLRKALDLGLRGPDKDTATVALSGLK